MRGHFARRVGWLSQVAVVVALSGPMAAVAQAPRPSPGATTATSPTGSDGAGDYVIGPDDVLSIVFWRDKEMSAEVTVRSDGKISLPLLNDMPAAGRTPEQLRAEIVKAAGKYLEEPSATVVVREIRSRKVFITGNVTRPSAYGLTDQMTVLQLIAVAGGLLEYADTKNIVVIRTEAGVQRSLRVNYHDLIRRKNLHQNIPLRPGDTVVVP